MGQVQAIVQRLVEEVGGYDRIYRFPYWLRPGYAKELYLRVDKPA